MNWLEEEFRKTEEEWAELPVWARPVYVPGVISPEAEYE